MDQDILTMLELIRLEGIVKMLWDTIDHEELAETVHVICQNENENIRSELDRMARQQLIEIASQHDDPHQWFQWRCGLFAGGPGSLPPLPSVASEVHRRRKCSRRAFGDHPLQRFRGRRRGCKPLRSAVRHCETDLHGAHTDCRRKDGGREWNYFEP